MAQRFTSLSAILGLSLLAAAPATSAIIATLTQTSTGVDLTITGSLDLTGASFQFELTPLTPLVAPSKSSFASGSGRQDQYGVQLIGPASFGPGLGASATSTSGDAFVLSGATNGLRLPVGYSSFAQITSSAHWNGFTLAGLGATPGSYVWSWAGGNDTITLHVVPEPKTALLFTLGLTMLGARARSVKASD